MLHHRLRAQVLSLTAAVTLALVVPLLGAAPSYAGLSCGGVPLPGDDCTPPTTAFDATPDASTTSTAAGFAFHVTSDEPLGVTFACRLQGPGQAGDWVDCTDPTLPLMPATTGSISYQGLEVGHYTFSVRATDKALGTPNVEDPPLLYSWDVVAPDPSNPPSTDAPDTTITTVVPRWYLLPYIAVRYQGDKTLIDADCQVNGKARDCTHSQVVIPSMAPHDYTLSVAGIDADGNTDPTPAVAQWTLPWPVKTLNFSSGWKTKRDDGSYLGYYARTTRAGATVKLARKDYRSAALVATRCPGCGKVEVSQGSTVLARIDLAAKKTRKGRVYPLGSWKRPRSTAITVRVVKPGAGVVVEGIGFSGLR